MMYFFTADTHFNHKNIIEYCKRPFKDIDEMNNELIKRWNETVSEEDTVFHLGDFSFRGYWTFRNKLNGKIILLRGNHDNNEQSVIKEININLGGIDWYLTHIPPVTNRQRYCLKTRQ